MPNCECRWEPIYIGANRFETMCGERFEFLDEEDAPDTKFRYCPFCSGEIEVKDDE